MYKEKESVTINEFNTNFYSPEQGLQPDCLLKHSKINLNLFKKMRSELKHFK
jgi:hypothetical protein